MMIDVKEWLAREAPRSRAARSALNKGRHLQPAVGDRLHLDPICRLGNAVRKYAGDRCLVVTTQYDPPMADPHVPPLVEVEFADGFRYWINPWHLAD
jgi:hypothetical protein